MKTLLLALALVSSAYAQTYPTNPKIVTTRYVGWTEHWIWTPPTQNVDGSAITGALTYDVWMSTGGTFSEIASKLTSASYAETKLPLGTVCVYVVAEEAGANTIPSPPSNIACVKVLPASSVQPKAPTALTGY